MPHPPTKQNIISLLFQVQRPILYFTPAEIYKANYDKNYLH